MKNLNGKQPKTLQDWYVERTGTKLAEGQCENCRAI